MSMFIARVHLDESIPRFSQPTSTPHIHHLAYADAVIIFSIGRQGAICRVIRALKEYEEIFGQMAHTQEATTKDFGADLDDHLAKILDQEGVPQAQSQEEPQVQSQNDTQTPVLAHTPTRAHNEDAYSSPTQVEDSSTQGDASSAAPTSLGLQHQLGDRGLVEKGNCGYYGEGSFEQLSLLIAGSTLQTPGIDLGTADQAKRRLDHLTAGIFMSPTFSVLIRPRTPYFYYRPSDPYPPRVWPRMKHLLYQPRIPAPSLMHPPPRTRMAPRIAAPPQGLPHASAQTSRLPCVRARPDAVIRRG
nr:uncharacterized protein LOC109157602 [Ipomoea batatas]